MTMKQCILAWAPSIYRLVYQRVGPATSRKSTIIIALGTTQMTLGQAGVQQAAALPGTQAANFASR